MTTTGNMYKKKQFQTGSKQVEIRLKPDLNQLNYDCNAIYELNDQHDTLTASVKPRICILMFISSRAPSNRQ